MKTTVQTTLTIDKNPTVRMYLWDDGRQARLELSAEAADEELACNKLYGVLEALRSVAVGHKAQITMHGERKGYGVRPE